MYIRKQKGGKIDISSIPKSIKPEVALLKQKIFELNKNKHNLSREEYVDIFNRLNSELKSLDSTHTYKDLDYWIEEKPTYRKDRKLGYSIKQKPPKFKSGSDLSSMFGGIGSTVLSQLPSFIQNPNAPQVSVGKNVARQIGNQVANAALPGLGNVLQVAQGFADKLGKEECDPVTGECADDSSDLAIFGKAVLDPVGTSVDLISGKYSNKKLEEIKRRARQRKINEYNQAKNVIDAQNLVQQQNMFKTMGDNFGYMQEGGKFDKKFFMSFLKQKFPKKTYEEQQWELERPVDYIVRNKENLDEIDADESIKKLSKYIGEKESLADEDEFVNYLEEKYPETNEILERINDFSASNKDINYLKKLYDRYHNKKTKVPLVLVKQNTKPINLLK